MSRDVGDVVYQNETDSLTLVAVDPDEVDLAAIVLRQAVRVAAAEGEA